MSLFAVNNQKPPKPWKIISWFGSSSSGLGDKGGKAAPQRKESPAEPKDIQRAKRLNERFTAFKKQLGAYYRAYALKSVYGIQIKKYVPAQLGGVDSDKFRPVSNGQSVIDKMLQKRFGISLKQFEEKTITELRKIFGKAESTPAPKKAEKKEGYSVAQPKLRTYIIKVRKDYATFDFQNIDSIDENSAKRTSVKNAYYFYNNLKQIALRRNWKLNTDSVNLILTTSNRKYQINANSIYIYVQDETIRNVTRIPIIKVEYTNNKTAGDISREIVTKISEYEKTNTSSKAEKKAPTPKPAPKKAETVPPIKKVEPAPAPVPKTEAPSEQEGIKQLDEIKALITSAIQNKKAA